MLLPKEKPPVAGLPLNDALELDCFSDSPPIALTEVVTGAAKLNLTAGDDVTVDVAVVAGTPNWKFGLVLISLFSVAVLPPNLKSFMFDSVIGFLELFPLSATSLFSVFLLETSFSLVTGVGFMPNMKSLPKDDAWLVACVFPNAELFILPSSVF